MWWRKQIPFGNDNKKSKNKNPNLPHRRLGLLMAYLVLLDGGVYFVGPGQDAAG